MKRILTFILIIVTRFTFAQSSSIYISTTKTTSLIFPFPVKYVDRGSKDLLVQQVKEQDNILLVKAATRQFPETNLTVITGEGLVYAFTVNYDDDPGTLVWQMPVQHEANVATYANNIIDNPATMHGVRNASFDISAELVGIYIRGGTIYYQLKLDNKSTIDYDINYLSFSIRDKKKAQRTATQQIGLSPLYIAGNVKLIKANSHEKMVFAFPKFTIPDAKFFFIQIDEKNGGRNLKLRINNRHIMKAIPLPDLR